MSVKCLASDYVVTERNGISYVYNKIYEENEKMILAAAILGLFIPEASDYYIPICIEITDCNSDVVVTKKLQVEGSGNYRYFIASHQYKKWKRVYLVIKSIVYIISIVIDVLFAYLFIKTNFNFLLGICVVCLLFLTCGAILKLEISNRRKRRFEIIDIAFEDDVVS